jgi:hypothetical protein
MRAQAKEQELQPKLFVDEHLSDKPFLKKLSNSELTGVSDSYQLLDRYRRASFWSDTQPSRQTA